MKISTKEQVYGARSSKHVSRCSSCIRTLSAGKTVLFVHEKLKLQFPRIARHETDYYSQPWLEEMIYGIHAEMYAKLSSVNKR